MKQMLKALFILAIICSCKTKHASHRGSDPIIPSAIQRGEQQQGNPDSRGSAPLRSQDVKRLNESHSLSLHDYEFNDNSEFAEVSRKQLFFDVQTKTIDEEVERSERRRKGETFSNKILHAAEKYDVILADITENGYFYDVQTKKIVEKSEDRCFFTAFDYETGVFYSRSDFWVAPFFTFLNLKFNVLISGQLCLSRSGRIKTYKNNGPLSLPGLGLENFISILLSRGMAFIDQDESGNSFNLAGSSFFRKVKKLIRKTEIPESTVVRALSDKLETAKIKQNSNLSSGQSLASAKLEGAVSVGGGAKAVPVQMVFSPSDALPANSRLSDVTGLFLLELTNYGSIKQLSAPGKHVKVLHDGRTLEYYGDEVIEGGNSAVRILTIKGTDGVVDKLAVKTFNNVDVFEIANRNIDEFLILGDSPFFLKKYGVVKDVNGDKAIIFEGADLDYFDYYLNKVPSNTFSKKTEAGMLDMIESVQAIHQRGFIHWDIKLENMMIDSKGQTKIIDLDNVSKAPNGQDPSDAGAGTLNYLAPERMVIEGENPYVYKKFDWTKTDVYSLGISLLEMQHGKRFTSIYKDVMGTNWNGGVSQLVSIRNGSFQTKLGKHKLYGKSKKYPGTSTIMKMLDPDPVRRIDLNEAQLALQKELAKKK